MFTYAYDEKACAAVFLFTGDTNDDEDFERYIEAVDELDRLANGRPEAAVVTFVERGNPPPNAKWRQKIGERSRLLKTRAVAVLVSESPMIRGVMTVLNWIAPKRFEDQTTLATWEEAITWVEARRGSRRLVLNVLLREAQVDAERRRAKR